MPRRQTRCPDVKQDAQANEMPRCPMRCPGKQDAQANEMPRCPMRCPGKQDAQMPRQTRCPDVTRDAQMSHEMPRCQISLGLGRYASGPIESGHLGRCASGPIESGQMCIWAY